MLPAPSPAIHPLPSSAKPQIRKSKNASASLAGWYLAFMDEVLGGSFLEYPAEHPKISAFGVDGIYFVAGVTQLLS